MKALMFALLFTFCIQMVSAQSRSGDRRDRRDRDLYEKNKVRIQEKHGRDPLRYRYCEPNDPNCPPYYYPNQEYDHYPPPTSYESDRYKYP